MNAFLIVSVVGVLIAVFAAWLQRGGAYAGFLAALLSAYTIALFPLHPYLPPIALYFHLTVFGFYTTLARPQMPAPGFRWLVSLPAAWFIGSTFFAVPWSLAAAFDLSPAGLWIPYLLGFVGVLQSLVVPLRFVDLQLDGQRTATLRRYPHQTLPSSPERPLRLFQISDPHLGHFMPIARLRRICRHAVAMEPDLILLTGDYLTMAAEGTPGALAEALAPLRALEGRVFACLGNHDQEAPTEVHASLAAAGARLLVDEAALVETPAGLVQIIGADFTWTARAQHLSALCTKFPRHASALRLWLLHDPSAMTALPEGEADLVLSGHTHGGQVGLVSLGVPWTVMGPLFRIPDVGFWARGRDRLYIHRGTGHYGFPLRLGVPAERSLVRVFRPG